eukprot:UN08871
MSYPNNENNQNIQNNQQFIQHGNNFQTDNRGQIKFKMPRRVRNSRQRAINRALSHRSQLNWGTRHNTLQQPHSHIYHDPTAEMYNINMSPMEPIYNRIPPPFQALQSLPALLQFLPSGVSSQLPAIYNTLGHP